jgi:MFS family permease
MKARSARIGHFLGLNRNIALLLFAIILIGAGEETWMRFVPKYLQALGGSVFVIALFDGLKTLLGAVYAYPGGVAADRLGHRRALMAFTAISLAGYGIVLLFPVWPAVIAGMFLFLAWSNLSLPATFSVVAINLPERKHAIGIGVQSLIRRVPILIGPVAGGILLDAFGVVQGVRCGVLISLVLGAAALLVQRRFRDEPAPVPEQRLNFSAAVRGFSPGLKRLLLSDVLIRFCERIPFAWVVIYALDDVGINASQLGVLIAIEMATAILCYVPASSMADRYGKEPFVIATFVFFTLFPLSLLWAHSFAALILAFVIRGLKEFGEPARKALIIGFAPPSIRGQTIGAYYLIRDVVATGGSFAGAALWQFGPEANFWGAFAVGTAGTAVYWATRTGTGRSGAALT